MLKRLRFRLTYANVMATLAVFIALGGVGYAAATVTGADVVDESLTGADIKGKNGTSTTAGTNGSLTGADIAGQAANSAVGQPFVQGSLTTNDIKDGTLGTADLANGAVKNGKLASDAVGSDKVLDNSLTGSDVSDGSLTGSDVSDDSLTGQDIDEFTLRGTIQRIDWNVNNAPKQSFYYSLLYPAADMRMDGTCSSGGLTVYLNSSVSASENWFFVFENGDAVANGTAVGDTFSSTPIVTNFGGHAEGNATYRVAAGTVTFALHTYKGGSSTTPYCEVHGTALTAKP